MWRRTAVGSLEVWRAECPVQVKVALERMKRGEIDDRK